jgi:lipoate-protein ligase A
MIISARADIRLMRSVEKIVGGKLVSVEVWPSDRSKGQAPGTAIRVRISGDFFLHPEDAIEDMESSLTGMGLDSEESDIEATIKASLARSKATLIGATASDIARLFVKAVKG